MVISDKGILELTKYEGLCLSPYYDSVGVITIGFGSTVSDIPDLPQQPLTTKITVNQAFDYFRHGLYKYEQAVNKAVHVSITQYQFDALVSLCYNIGVNGLARSSLIRDINVGAPTEVIIRDFNMWNKGGGRVIRGLKIRRAAEANLYVTGNYTANGIVTLTDTDGKGRQINPRPFDLKPYIIQADAPQEVVTETPTWADALKRIFEWLWTH